jgi:hypothetical protein
MRLWLLTFAVLSVSAIPALAADEFGARFGEDTPAALDDNNAASLENIAPAAGDEETSVTEKTPAVATDPNGLLKEDPSQSLLKSDAVPEASIPETQPAAGEPAEAEQAADEADAALEATPSEETKEQPAAQ